MKNSNRPESPEGGTNLIIITHASSDGSKMVATSDEQLKFVKAFCKGLDQKEYSVTVYEYAQDRQKYIEHASIGQLALGKKPEQYPLTFIDDKLVWSNTYPTNDELANLLKIGCRDVHEGSDCCLLSSCRIRK